jgi:hypothetical protein
VQRNIYLKLFIAAQEVALALWRINRAQDHPSFRATLFDFGQTASPCDETAGIESLKNDD